MNGTEIKMVNLKNLNLAAGITHTAVLGGIVAWVVSSYDASSNAIDTSLFRIDNSGEQIGLDEVSPSQGWTIVILIILFLLVTIAAHFIYFALTKWYTERIDNENNYARWIEYAISASIMIVLIGFTVGVKSFVDTILIAVMTALTMAMGHYVETALHTKDKKMAIIFTIIGWVLFALVWYIITSAFATTMKSSDVPNFVPAVFVLMFVLFASFGVVQLVQLIKHPSYDKIECSYIILSFVAKTLLVFLVTSGLVARS